MASVTVNIPASAWGGSATNAVWNFVSGSRLDLGLSLAAPGVSGMFLDTLAIARSGRVLLRLAPSQTAGEVPAGPDFSDQMEMSGTITFRASDGQEVTVTGISDSTEPYAWIPSNSAAVGSFANHVASLISNRGLTVTFDDNFAPPSLAPGAPSTPTLVAGREQIKASWNAPGSLGTDPITSYDVRYRLTGTTTWTTVDPATSGATSYTITGLTGGQTYEVQVRAVSAAGNGSWSASASAAAQSLSTPDAPAAPTITPFSNGNLLVTWNPPTSTGGSAITNYDLRYRRVDGGWTVIDSATSGGRNYTLSGLDRGRQYDVQVRAVNAQGDGAWSASRRATTRAAAPNAPVISSLTPGDETVAVQWAKPTEDGGATIIEYDLRYRRTGTSSWTTLQAVSQAGTRSYTLSGLTNDQSYDIQVRATNSVGDGGWSATVMATPVAGRSTVIIIDPVQPIPVDSVQPSPPDRVVISRIVSGNRRLEIFWNDPADDGSSNIDYYDVRIRSAAEWTLIDRASNERDDLSHLIHGLQNGVEYDVQVRAVNSELPGPWSAIYRATPLANRVARVGFVKLINWDNRMWGITSEGQLYYAFDFDGGWVESAAIPVHETPVTDLFIYRDSGGEPTIYAMTVTALWVLDLDNEHWLRTDVTLPRSLRNGVGITTWRGDLYIPAGNQVYRYGGGPTPVLSLVGPGRDQGIPWAGDTMIVKLEASHNALLAAVKSLDESDNPVGTSRVLAYDGVGWQELWAPRNAEGVEQHEVLQDILVASIYGEYSVWIGAEELKVIDIPFDVVNPMDFDPTRRYAAWGQAITPWFNANEAELDKVALEFKVEALNLSSTETLTVEYGLNYDEDTWYPIVTDLAESGLSRYPQPSQDDREGIPFRELRFRITAKSGNAEVSPDLNVIGVEFKRHLLTKWGFAIQVDLNYSELGLSPIQQRDNLVAVSESDVLVPFSYTRDDGEEEVFWVDVATPDFTEQASEGPVYATLRLIEL